MTIFMTIPTGQSVRDFLILPTVRLIRDKLPGSQVVVLSPAHAVEGFRALCGGIVDGIDRMELPACLKRNAKLMARRRTSTSPGLAHLLTSMEARRYRPPKYLSEAFDCHKPSLVVTTHPVMSWEYEVVMAARRLGIRTVGVLKSWDNIWQGLISRPHELSVWNRVNREEAIRMQAYLQSEVVINGAPSFDAYFNPEWRLERFEFLSEFGLDPERPIVTYATCGVFNRGYAERDETHLADDLLRMFATTPKLRDAQLLIRLHPSSRLEQFWPFLRRRGVAASFVSYLPAIGWCPSRRDLLIQASILKYSDVVVTPASSWCIEAAILDTPTIVPVYSDTQPLHARIEFDDNTLSSYFRPLVEQGWVPICRSYDELRTKLVEAMNGRHWFAKERSAIVDEYVHFRDANSCARVAAWIAERAASA